MNKLPRLLLCASASGGGKTTMTCTLLQALVNRGVNPVAFKCGPDYIDPMFHSEIIGARARNLDLFFLGEDGVRQLLVKNGRTGDVAIMEGVMGYYDGIGMGSEASAYHLSRATATPSVLVVDGRGRALSVAAEVKGFLTFRPDSGIEGVILNRVSPMLYPRLKACIEEETGVRVYGYLPTLPQCAFESRHLGLVTAAEVGDIKNKLSILATQGEQSLDLDGLLALATTAPDLTAVAMPVSPVKNRPKIAIAQDKAFCFYYADGLALLEEFGAELIPFSPLADDGLPQGCSGLYLGGGYPEVYAKELSENKTMRDAIRTAVTGGMPTVAECGGFLYLHEALEGEDRRDYPMAGVFPHRGYRTEKLNRFGYVTLTAREDNLLCQRGETIPAHEFHYWESEENGDAFRAQKPQSQRGWDCVHGGKTLYAGFPHFHFCARPSAAARFVTACAKYEEELKCRW